MHTRPSLLWSSSSKGKFTSYECTRRPHFCDAIQATVQHPHLENWNSDHVSSQIYTCLIICQLYIQVRGKSELGIKTCIFILTMCCPDAALSATPRKKTHTALYTAVTLLTLNGKISGAVKHGGVWTSAWDLAEEIFQVWWCTLIAIFNGWLTSTVNGASSLSMNLYHESIISGIICPSASRKSWCCREGVHDRKGWAKQGISLVRVWRQIWISYKPHKRQIFKFLTTAEQFNCGGILDSKAWHTSSSSSVTAEHTVVCTISLCQHLYWQLEEPNKDNIASIYIHSATHDSSQCLCLLANEIDVSVGMVLIFCPKMHFVELYDSGPATQHDRADCVHS